MVQITPKISATEAAALEAGTIGFDRDIFDGTASLDGLKKKYPLVSLNEREQKFIDNEVRGFPPPPRASRTQASKQKSLLASREGVSPKCSCVACC